MDIRVELQRDGVQQVEPSGMLDEAGAPELERAVLAQARLEAGARP